MALAIVTEGLDSAPLAWLRARCDVVECRLDEPAFSTHLARAEALVVRTYTRVNAALLAQAPRLRVVGRGGVGLENIDIPACRARGVEVVYTPDANTRAVGEYVFSLLLQMIRPYAFFRDAAYKPPEFKRLRDTLRGRQLDELTLGILGMGRVGRRVGQIASRGFEMNVIYHDLLDVSRSVDFPARAVGKDRLLEQADILTIHVDMRPGNEHLVGASELARMRRGSWLVNTSRGEVLDVQALASALKSGHLAGAALDVYAPEPPPPDFPLLGLSNVLLAPHMAARTGVALENMSWVVRDIVEVLEGRSPRHPAP
jgi:D-3-phosphoglycerate dehydrogenase